MKFLSVCAAIVALACTTSSPVLITASASATTSATTTSTTTSRGSSPLVHPLVHEDAHVASGPRPASVILHLRSQLDLVEASFVFGQQEKNMAVEEHTEGVAGADFGEFLFQSLKAHADESQVSPVGDCRRVLC